MTVKLSQPSGWHGSYTSLIRSCLKHAGSRDQNGWAPCNRLQSLSFHHLNSFITTLQLDINRVYAISSSTWSNLCFCNTHNMLVMHTKNTKLSHVTIRKLGYKYRNMNIYTTLTETAVTTAVPRSTKHIQQPITNIQGW